MAVPLGAVISPPLAVTHLADFGSFLCSAWVQSYSIITIMMLLLLDFFLIIIFYFFIVFNETNGHKVINDLVDLNDQLYFLSMDRYFMDDNDPIITNYYYYYY